MTTTYEQGDLRRDRAAMRSGALAPAPDDRVRVAGLGLTNRHVILLASALFILPNALILAGFRPLPAAIGAAGPAPMPAGTDQRMNVAS